ncbi:MAG: hypothetical protein JXQ67_07035 [Campylobacterales bacterium]|nr:hypothetical protein [Campylobacterales bacterium]
MINFSLEKKLQLILPNQNKALAQVLKDATPTQLLQLTNSKDLNSLLVGILQKSIDSPEQNATLLTLLKSNPTLKELANFTSSLKTLQTLLTKQEPPLELEKNIKNFLGELNQINPKELKTKIENSGVFLESKLLQTNTPQETKALLQNDLKALLLQTYEEISNGNTPNKQELMRALERVILQLDYYQLSSHLSNGSAFYVPYSWDALEEGVITIKQFKEKAYFCDIDLKLKEHGELKLRLGLFEQKLLNINIQTQSKLLKEKITEQLSELKKALFDVGITPGEIRFIEDTNNSNSYATTDTNLQAGFEVKV